MTTDGVNKQTTSLNNITDGNTRPIMIDGEIFDVDERLTLIQTCSLIGKEIPRFCYHERLSIAGNCRMCLVEVEGMPRLQASCALQVRDLRPARGKDVVSVYTDSEEVRKAREGVVEFLLINHPLDCPICDQGGECDLQDQTIAYGSGKSRYYEAKRAQPEVNFGPLINTAMTRCIYCTRCVRFMNEIAGVPEIGMLGRGENSRIVTPYGKAITSELQGNLVDICPVGALMSRPYAHQARPWELEKTPGIDVMDALGSNIRIDTRGPSIMRIMPRENSLLNEEWLSDKSRFICDAFALQRLDRPYMKDESGRLSAVSWDEAIAKVSEHIRKACGGVAAIAGDLVPVETLWLMKKLLSTQGSGLHECRHRGEFFPIDNRAAWLFNPTVAALDDADAILLVGTNPREECSILNTRIRKAWLAGATIGRIGKSADLTYPVHELGETFSAMSEESPLFWGNTEFGKVFREAKSPVIILGIGGLLENNSDVLLEYCMAAAEKYGATFGVLHIAASLVGGMDTGFVTDGGIETIYRKVEEGDVSVVFSLGADECKIERLKNSLVVYIGSHGSDACQHVDVILPAASYVEQTGLYLNLEGRPQISLQAIAPPGKARQEWEIIQALIQRVSPGTSVCVNDDQVRDCIVQEYPHIGNIGEVESAEWHVYKSGKVDVAPDFCSSYPICDFYRSNAISKASVIMAKLSSERRKCLSSSVCDDNDNITMNIDSIDK